MAIELSTLTFTNRSNIIPLSGVEQIFNTGIANTLAGNDLITGISSSSNLNNIGIANDGTIDTGAGKDTISATATGRVGYAIQNRGTIDTGENEDTITATGSFYGIYNFNRIYTGAGADTITATGDEGGIVNAGIIDTGNGSDVITGIASIGSELGGIFNNSDGVINTGNGDDIIIGTGRIGIENSGTINTGHGNDSIIANGGFSSIGSVFLGNGSDYLKGFGSGNFNGGNGQDTLELTAGNYTVGISGTTVSFTSNSITMNTSEFERLIAGNTTYNFICLTNGQTITIV